MGRGTPMASEAQRLVSSPRLAGELLAWQPEVGLVDGLARTIELIEANAGRFRVDHYVI